MNKKDVKIGMKVVPFQKTVRGYGKLESSSAWEKAKRVNQPYLYVISYDSDGYWVLSNSKNSSCDFFNSYDFREYIEENIKEDIKTSEKVSGKIVSYEDRFYGNIGHETPLVDIFEEKLYVGDTVSMFGFEDSMVCTNRGDIMGIFGTTQQDVIQYGIKKIKSYTELKSGETYSRGIKAVLDEVKVKVEKLKVEVKVEKLKLEGTPIKPQDDSIIGSRTPLKDIKGAQLYVGDVVKLKDGDISIVCNADGCIMWIFGSNTQEGMEYWEVEKIKSYTKLKKGERYCDCIDVVSCENNTKETITYELKGTTSIVTVNGKEGKARLSPTDTFDKARGFRYAYSRAVGDKNYNEGIESFSNEELLEELTKRLKSLKSE